MLVYDLDGNKYEWKPRGTRELFESHRGSGLHKIARKLLKVKYPTMTILEEVSIKVRKRKTLYFDFYIPILKRAIEVQGQQHFTFNSAFHKSKKDLMKQFKNDREKSEWCDLNNIELTQLRFDNQDEWENII